MRTLAGRPLDFPSLGWLAVEWIEEYAVFGPGDVAGRRVRLTEEDVRFFVWLYRLHPDTGRRLATDADLSGPKGYAKSQIAGFDCLFEAFGPCRFDGWDANGEPVGRPLTSPFIRCLATEETQSANTYRNVLYALEHSDALADEYDYDAGKTATFLPGGGEIRISTSGSASKDGGLETLVVPDETHLYVLPELREMYATVERNCGKRRDGEPLLLRTSTMFAPGEESVAEANWREFEAYGCDAERALVEGGLLVDHREAPEDVDITNDEELHAALVELYGEKAEIVDIDRIIRRHFRRPGADIPAARRYYLNQRVKAEGKWIAAKRWDALLARRARLRRDDMVALGFDGSRTKDGTALVACRLTDGLLQVVGYWERPRRLPSHVDWEVDGREVDQVVIEAMDFYDVRAFLGDVHWWRQEIDSWHGKWPEVVTRFDTSKTGRMVWTVHRMRVAIETRAIRHTGDRRLRTHVLNTYAVRQRTKLDATTFGVTLSKVNRDSRDLIDLCMAATLAVEARGVAIAAGALEEEAVDRTLYLPD